MNRTDVINALKREREDLVRRLNACDAALLAFDVKPPASAAPGEVRRHRRPARHTERALAILAYVQEAKDEHGHQRWLTSREVAEGAGIPMGTTSNVLRRLVREGQLLEDTDNQPWTWCAP